MRPQSGPLPRFYTGFFCAGVAFALPGVLLPSLLARWHWDDRHGGWFFLLIATGSLLAPLTIRRPHVSVFVGYILVALAAAVWIWTWLQPTYVLAPYVAAPLWGFGLSLVMTGISLGCRSLTANPAVLLLRLNFLWSFGAVCAPIFRLVLLHVIGVPQVLAAIVVLFTAQAGAAARRGPPGNRPPPSQQETRPSLSGVPLRFIAVTALATGVEASTGAWLATYAGRLHLMVNVGLSATATFWAGLLLSRSLAWRIGARSSSPAVLRGLLTICALASLCLLEPFPDRTPAAMLLAASLALGFGLGPLYPEFLSRVLCVRPSTLIFTTAGVASAIMPWLAGQVSACTGALRFGFLIPAAGAVLMLLTGWSAAALQPALSPAFRPAPSPQTRPDA